MNSRSNKSWAEWLNNHPSREVYDAHPGKVVKLCFEQKDGIAKFKKLVENKNIVLLTKSPIGRKLQATFHHSVVGVPLIPEDVHAPPEVGPSRRSLARSLTPSLTLLTLSLVCAPSHLTLLTLLTLSHSVSFCLR